ncbi:hypothetical protein FJZ31_08630 [Candidatus Poribacteria bacterium]|nr:hypothetical protein [Candidatus Poribacteria bacterium]
MATCRLFSGPLLANPHFRNLFSIRLKEITETIYTEEVFLPIINQMAKRLEPEVQIRADANGQDVEKIRTNINLNCLNNN